MGSKERLEAATAAHRQGDLATAEAGYREVLAEEPGQPDALHFLGLAAFQRGDAEQAVTLIRQSLDGHAANAAAQNNLGNILKLMGRREEALAAYSAAIGVDPTHADSWNNVGVLLRGAERMEEAAEVLQRAVGLDPQHAEAWHNLGLTCLLSGRLEEAAHAFEACLDLGTRRWSDPVWHARVLCALGRQERAVEHLGNYLEANPADPVATHQLAAIRGEAPERASDDYVRRHFDSFSDNFDEVLGRLDYRAPQIVADAVAERVGSSGPLPDVVDLGCGTGLCGPLIRRHAERLTGVDLSRGMLAQAARREVYDHLVEGELVAFLREAPPIRFDLVVCVDTLCYFGALEPVIAALAGALKPGGAMIATVERLETPDGAGFHIGQSGRYAHRRDYLAKAAEGSGLALRRADPVVLRKELGCEVHGLVFEVELPAGA